MMIFTAMSLINWLSFSIWYNQRKMNFDEDWIKNFKVSSKRLLKVFYCYVDKDNTLHKINQEIIEVKNNVIKRDELVRLIVSNKRKHQLLSVLCYNIGDIDETTDFKEFMNSFNI